MPVDDEPHTRLLGACAFRNERSKSPISNGTRTWDQIVALHGTRDLRPNKSGLMFGGYRCDGSRCDAHVTSRSVLQLDIDTDGKKESSGRILEVRRRAPDLDVIRQAIAPYEWVAASSHWHEPHRGVVKYRIVILLDRDIERHEHKAILEALDELLGGALDRAAWAWSQAFYLPSCPEENSTDAFFVRNVGAALPVETFIERGRAIAAGRGTEAQRTNKRLDASPDMAIGGNVFHAGGIDASRSEGPPTASEMRVMLEFLVSRGRFEHRKGVESDIDGRITKLSWIETGMALKVAYGDDPGLALWAITHFDDQARKDAPRQWQSFASKARPGLRRIGTIIKAARDAGFASGTDLGDVKNGRLFADAHRGRMLNIHETDDWLVFDGERGWCAGSPGEADRAAKLVLAIMRDRAAEHYKAAPDDPNTKRLMDHVKKTSLAPRLRAMIDMARSEPGITVRLSEFDADPMLLGAANGVLDLRTGTLLPVTHNILVSKRCTVSFEPNARCPRFERFLAEVQPDSAVRNFLQRWVGYCLTGRVDEQVFVFLYGHGANGKSVFIETVARLLGDYARKIPTDMLMHHQRNPQGPSPDIVSLKGRRYIYANETEEGRRLAEARLKELTGGDTLTGRVPYGKADITFAPNHKLVIAGNHKPEITDASMGMWRRVVLIPFDQTIPEANQDKDLREKLEAEGAGILNWALEGLRAYVAGGLRVPETIRAATAAYRDEQDILGDFLIECFDVGPGYEEKRDAVYPTYSAWCERNGHGRMSQNKLTRRLGDRGHKLTNHRRLVKGLALKKAAMLGGFRP